MKLSVGDGLVSQIPALIVSLAAGLLVSKGGTRGSADQAVFGQLGGYPRALSVAALLMVLGVMPGLPLLPFAFLGGLMAFVGYVLPRRLAARPIAGGARAADVQERAQAEFADSIKEYLKTAKSSFVLAASCDPACSDAHDELAHRVTKYAAVCYAVWLRHSGDQAYG